jgi:transcriptional regulator with XRE-family HTH domain
MNTEKKIKPIRDAEAFLDDLLGGPMTFGGLLHSLRLCEEISQIEFAAKLGISRSQLCDIEKGRKLVSPRKAVEYAKILKHSKILFVQTALQDQVNQVCKPYIVKLEKKIA